MNTPPLYSARRISLKAVEKLNHILFRNKPSSHCLVPSEPPLLYIISDGHGGNVELLRKLRDRIQCLPAYGDCHTGTSQFNYPLSLSIKEEHISLKKANPDLNIFVRAAAN